jgi:hypothetical protein
MLHREKKDLEMGRQGSILSSNKKVSGQKAEFKLRYENKNFVYGSSGSIY